MSRDREPGLLESLLADVEWNAGELPGVDDHDPEGWRASRLDVKALVSCLPRPGFHAAVLYRLSRWFRKRGLKPVSFGLQLVNQALTGAEISHNADIGPGLRILHPTGVYIGSDVRIGFRSTFNQGSAVQKNLNEGSGNPDCGNYLAMSPGAKVLGGVRVGHRVWVGPNSTAVADIDDDTTVLGVPARPLPPDEEMP